MREVSAFEADLLRILTCFLGRAPLTPVLPLLARTAPRPACLSADAIAAVQDMLSKGCVLALARDGGWRRERRPRGEQVAAGRLWERSPPSDLAFEFSRNSLDFLLWTTAHNCVSEGAEWRPPAREAFTIGDRWLFFLAYSSVRRSTVADVLRRGPACDDHALCWLMFADDYADEARAGARPEFSAWTTLPGLAVLEALQSGLASAWRQMEGNKAHVTTAAEMMSRGDAQRCVLEAFLPAVDRRGAATWRCSWRRFANDRWPTVRRVGWPTSTCALSLAERGETYRAACAVLTCLETLACWQEQARGVGFLDEGYALAQLWKSEWERCDGDAICRGAADLLRQLDPLNIEH